MEVNSPNFDWQKTGGTRLICDTYNDSIWWHGYRIYNLNLQFAFGYTETDPCYQSASASCLMTLFF